jgi:hypothetical protein
MVFQMIQALFALTFAKNTARITHTPLIGTLAGNGGWNAEDSNHYRP